ncbi:hypothetical protein ABFY57_12085 [Paenibacillus polymyxa]|uniref:hypothetical protein n=1 Tax=Paenibacillus polymyxa TaxID=1406 RepID=UPI0020185F19|nr:hypothetical protein [Paenibacillus polymyxa]UQQ36187.1 hypothetical protein LMH85_04510 [Paenibacillus polymyxa]
MQWYLFDERDGQTVTCEHCKKLVNAQSAKSKYYILQSELFNERNMITIGAGCVKVFTGQTIKEIKEVTEQAIRNQMRVDDIL